MDNNGDKNLMEMVPLCNGIMPECTNEGLRRTEEIKMHAIADMS